jgi:VWFA-related protein
MPRRLLAATATLLAAGWPGTAQQAGPNIAPRRAARDATPDSALERRADIRVDTTLVLIPVAVTDPLGRLFTGLERENFRLNEDRVEQQILRVSSEDAPISVGIVFDCSGSMGAKLQQSREAVRQFARGANAEDEFLLVQFNDRAQVAVPFTNDVEAIMNHLSFVQSRGQTALLDGVYLAMHEMKKAHNARKAILIISDGGDNSSRYTEREVRNAVREADVQTYAIGIFERMLGRTPEELAGPGLLNEITEQTGGRHFALGNVSDLPDVAAKIGVELRNQYVLAYSPSNQTRDGKYRRVEVRVANLKGLPPLKARYRTGYYAPSQ